MGKFYYCDDCMEGGPETKEATHLDVEMWNDKTRDLCDECYKERKEQGDLKEETLVSGNEIKK
jgi:hypothetical protein